VSAALIAAAFGFALPHVASSRSVWTSIQSMTWPYVLLVGTVAAASMVAYWVTIRAVLPWIRLRQAAAVSLGSNAVANTHPTADRSTRGDGRTLRSASAARLTAGRPEPRLSREPP
jgi:hypothetical protein